MSAHGTETRYASGCRCDVMQDRGGDSSSEAPSRRLSAARLPMRRLPGGARRDAASLPRPQEGCRVSVFWGSVLILVVVIVCHEVLREPVTRSRAEWLGLDEDREDEGTVGR